MRILAIDLEGKMFQLPDPQTGRIKAQVLHFKGGINLQLFDNQTRAPAKSSACLNLLEGEAEQLIAGMQAELEESRKVGGDWS